MPGGATAAAPIDALLVPQQPAAFTEPQPQSIAPATPVITPAAVTPVTVVPVTVAPAAPVAPPPVDKQKQFAELLKKLKQDCKLSEAEYKDALMKEIIK